MVGRWKAMAAAFGMAWATRAAGADGPCALARADRARTRSSSSVRAR